jgi:hypothetical protein
MNNAIGLRFRTTRIGEDDFGTGQEVLYILVRWHVIDPDEKGK